MTRKGFFLTPETFAPPIIGSLKITYTGSKTGGQEVMCAYNNFVFDPPVPGVPDPGTGTATVALKPFRTIDETVVGGETSPPSTSVSPARRKRFYASAISLFQPGRAALRRSLSHVD
jgi:hypothetical protein